MRGYELMYILDPTLDEDATQALISQVEDFITKQGVNLEKTEPWGKRRLAYRIGKHWEGYYVLSHFQADKGVVAELERRLRVTDGVMRFLTVRVDEEQRKLERKRAKKGITEVSRRERLEEPAPATKPSESAESVVEAAPERGEVSKNAAEAEVPPEEGAPDVEPTEDEAKKGAEPAGEAS